MAAYRRVYDSRHLQADCQVPGIRDQLRNPTLGNCVWATFFTCPDFPAIDIFNVVHQGTATMRPLATSTVATRQTQ